MKDTHAAKYCPVCRASDTMTSMCDENGKRKNYALYEMDLNSIKINYESIVPLRCDICTNCGHIMFFHAKPEIIEIKNR